MKANYDILATEDRSNAPTPSKSDAAKKREKFGWEAPGPVGDLEWIEKGVLHIDGRYQRQMIGEKKVVRLARGWRWIKLGVITVVRRSDGSLWVLDGGHRVRAAFYRDDIVKLPCMVFEAEDIKAEAKAFLGINTDSSPLSGYDRFMAQLTAGDHVAEMCMVLMDGAGLVPSRFKKKGGFVAVSSLVKCVGKNPELAEKVFSVCCDVAGPGESPEGDMVKGLFRLCEMIPGILTERTAKVLTSAGKVGVRSAINNTKALMNAGGEKVAAIGILNLVNKGLRNKFELPMKFFVSTADVIVEDSNGQ